MFEQFSYIPHCEKSLSAPGIEEYRIHEPGMQGNFQVFHPFAGIEYIIVRQEKAENTFPYQPLPGIIQFNLCLSGRLGWQLQGGQSIYIGAEDLSIHQMDNCPILSIHNPVASTTSVMMLMNPQIFDAHLPPALQAIGFKVPAMQRKLCQPGKVTLLPLVMNRESYAAFSKDWPLACQQTYIQLKFLELMLVLHANENASHQAAPYPTVLLDTIQAMHQELVTHLQQKITIEELSQRYYLNTTTIKKAFKYLYGEPIGQYLRTYRLHRALELLAGPTSIREIASEVGYENQSKFAHLFREKMNCSPSEYRKKYRKLKS